MTDEFPSRLLEKVVVRLPDGMRDRLKAAAEANNRSMNAEIVARLEDSLVTEGELLEGLSHISIAAMIKEHEERLTKASEQIEALVERLERRMATPS